MRIPRFVYRIGWALDRLADRLTGGRWDSLRPGPPTLRLRTIGRRTGSSRENALFYIEHEGDFVVVASNAGSERQPAWWLNLGVRPEASVRLRGQRIPVKARQASAAEEAALWPRLDRFLPIYADYRSQTSRPIPIVILERRT
jgi:deazaflavin-dependent oxidoreductase (nitroreductase family)